MSSTNSKLFLESHFEAEFRYRKAIENDEMLGAPVFRPQRIWLPVLSEVEALKKQEGLNSGGRAKDAVVSREALLHPACTFLFLAKDFVVLIFWIKPKELKKCNDNK